MDNIFELIWIIVVGAICGLILLLASLGLYALRHPDEVIVRSNPNRIAVNDRTHYTCRYALKSAQPGYLILRLYLH